jgi:hypothetical protein
LVLAVQQTSTVVILYSVQSHQQVVAAVRLLVRLILAVLVVVVHTPVAVVRLEIRLLHPQAKATTAVMVVPQAAVAVAVLVQLAATHRVLQVVQAAMVRHQASQAHR